MQSTIKTISFFLLLLFAAQNMNAQKISIGLKAGVQQANVKVPGVIEDISFLPDFEAITTANIGVVSEIELHPNFAIQPELNWTQKGFRVNEDFDVNLFDVPVPVGVSAITRFNYLEMPLLAKAKFGNFYVVAGPTFGFAMNGKLETRARAIVEFDLYDTPINLNNVGYERWEVGGMAGAGAAFPLPGGGQIFLDARYQHGFTQPYDIPLLHEKVQHKGWGVNVGFMLPIGGEKAGTPRA